MYRWFSYFFERFYPLTSFFVIAGVAISSALLSRNFFDLAAFMASCTLWFFLSFFFRINDDLNDLSTDKVAYPERPIPKGVIHPKEAKGVLKGLLACLAVLGAWIFLYFGFWSRLLLCVVTLYSWLFYHHFYLGKWLDQKPLFKAVLYQGIVFPVTLLSISLFRPQILLSRSNISYCLLLFGAFFTFELCRKLNPFSHPASQSLVHFFGFKKVFRFAVVSLLVSAIGAYGLGVERYLGAVQLGVFCSLLFMFKNPGRYIIAQIAANLSLVIHSWSAFLERI